MPYIPNTNRRYKHEDYTVAIITGPLKNVIEKHKSNVNYGITANDIADMIKGDPKSLGSRIFWKILISSQLDADRCDYLLRDSLHIGVKYGVYDLERLLVTLKLGKGPETNDIVLGIDEGGLHVAEGIVIARFQMFTQVYYHKTRRAYDFMLKEALKKTINEYPPPDRIEDFLKYDDYRTWHLMLNENEWFDNILKRNHIRMVMETEEMPSQEKAKKIEKLKEKLKESQIWFLEDCSDDAKLWYDLENEEIQIIDNEGKIKPLSQYSKIVQSLKMKFRKIRVYVKSEDKNRAKKLKEEENL
jgi:HD superfamily phosphohydrolase